MKIALILAFLVMPLVSQASGSEVDPYSEMNLQGLKRTVQQLEEELQGVKRQLARLEGETMPAGDLGSREGWLLDDFESGQEWDTKGGGSWWVGHDNNGMGTTREPDPFKPQKGGSPDSVGYSGRLHGYLGPNEEPWAWVSMDYGFGDQGKDLNEYKGIEFWIKGTGAEVKLQIKRLLVTDYCYHEKIIKPGAQWEKVYIPFSDFKQGNWGKQVDRDFKDIKSISWSPALHEAGYDFSIDQIKLIK